PTPIPKDTVIDDLDRVVRETLAYFEGPGKTTNARIDRWQARDVLMHFLYFHDATAWGIQSVAVGGPPWPVPADSHTGNQVSRPPRARGRARAARPGPPGPRAAHARRPRRLRPRPALLPAVHRRDDDRPAAARAAGSSLGRPRQGAAGRNEPPLEQGVRAAR